MFDTLVRSSLHVKPSEDALRKPRKGGGVGDGEDPSPEKRTAARRFNRTEIAVGSKEPPVIFAKAAV